MTTNVPNPLNRNYSSFRAALRAAEIAMYGDTGSSEHEVEFLFNHIAEAGVLYVGEVTSPTKVSEPVHIRQNFTSRGLSYRIEAGAL